MFILLRRSNGLGKMFPLLREYMLQYLSDPAITESENFLSLPLQDVNHLEDLRYVSVMYPALLFPALLPKLQMKKFSMQFSTIIQYIAIPNSFLFKLLFCKYDLYFLPLSVGLYSW